MSFIRRKTVEGLKAGDVFTVTRTFTEADVDRFADISMDFNPVHFEERFTRAKGFDGRICHGLLVGGLLTQIGGQIGWLASGMTFRFIKPVYFDQAIACVFTITEIDERGRARAEVTFSNAADEIVMEASLTGILPGNREIRVMRAMMAEGDPTNKLGGPERGE